MLGDGVRGHVNKALDYTTEISEHTEYLIVNRSVQNQQSKKKKRIGGDKTVRRDLIFLIYIPLFLC